MSALHVVVIAVMCAVLSAAPAAHAQDAPAPAAAVAAQAAPGQVAPPAPPPDYTYAPENRRDPFLSLVNRGTDARTGRPTGSRPDGVAGVGVEEVVVRGILQSRGGWIAMIAAPTGRTYTIKPGDKLLDGTVRTINGQAVILMQEVNDPLSLEKQREVRKFLRGEVK